MYDMYNLSSANGFEILGEVIVFIAENFWAVLTATIFIVFIFKIFAVMFWTSFITDIVTKRLEKEYNQRIELMLTRLEPVEKKEKKPIPKIDVSKYENTKIKL